MEFGSERGRWVRRGLRAAVAAGITVGSLSIGQTAYAAALAITPPAPTKPVMADTELKGYSNTYLKSVLEIQADSRAKALATLDRKADHYAEELAAQAELQAALLNAQSLGGGDFVAPMTSYVRSSSFGDVGPLWESSHTGEDFAAPVGTPLFSIGEGTVTDVGDAGAYGLRTIITLSDGTEIWYCHQATAVVKIGDHVSAGSPIGAVGVSGNTTGPHLHLEVRPGAGDPINPVTWLAALGIVV